MAKQVNIGTPTITVTGGTATDFDINQAKKDSVSTVWDCLSDPDSLLRRRISAVVRQPKAAVGTGYATLMKSKLTLTVPYTAADGKIYDEKFIVELHTHRERTTTQRTNLLDSGISVIKDTEFAALFNAGIITV